MDNEQLPYLLALWRAPGIGAVSLTSLFTQTINLKELFACPNDIIKHHALSPHFNAAVANADWQGVERDLLWANQANHHIITRDMPFYPPLLREINTAPPLLFVAGNIQLLACPQLAMVGTRNPTAIGFETAKNFAQAFAKEGLIITSGLALGIDTASHQGALNGGKTIAVMGTGADKLYPPQNRTLKHLIEENGALVTEFPVGVNVAAHHFPRRNRIMSGLSLGVLVVEAAAGSGSLITAQYALEHNREVFALPGSIHNPLARGCHQLIKQGAKLVETVTDVFEELHWQQQRVAFSPKPAVISPLLTPQQQSLLALIDFESTSIDVLVQRSGLTAEVVSSMLLLLELEGHILAVAGGYRRCPSMNH